MKKTHSKPSWKGIIFISLGTILLCILSIVAFFVFAFGRYFIMHLNDDAVEKATEKEVRAQVAQLPGVTITQLTLWEGDSIVRLQIKNKGNVDMWYRAGGPPRIESLQTMDKMGYGTEFRCERDAGGKREYAYQTAMEIVKDNAVGRKFSFEVKSITDIVRHFDEIIATLDTFPANPETLTRESENWGTQIFFKNPEERYSFRPPFEKDKNVKCFYYISKNKVDY